MAENKSTSFAVSCPAKIILHGEHAVVYGKTALATSIDLRTNATLTYNPPLKSQCAMLKFQMSQLSVNVSWVINEIVAKIDRHSSDEMLESLKQFVNQTDFDSNSNAYVACLVFLFLFTSICIHPSFNQDIHVNVESGAPLGSGLGSSAALSVCLTTLLLLVSEEIPIPANTSMDLKASDLSNAISSNSLKSVPFQGESLALINKWAFAGESIVHGTPSGIDNTLCTYGGIVRYKIGEFVPLRDFPSNISLSLIVIDSLVPKSTLKMISLVKERKIRIPEVIDPIFSSIDSISERCCQEFNKIIENKTIPNFELLEELIFVNHQLLCAIGVTHPQLENIVTIAKENGFTAKITGAGGGGCVIALITPQNEDKVGALRESLSERGFKSWVTQFGVEGISFLHL